MIKVSVIIPAYNAEKDICQCVDSVVGQTLKEMEIIIIDDGSTDQTGVILDERYGKYPNVKIIHQDNKGLYATRKRGLSMAEGEYVGWVDADDFVSTEMFQKLYQTAKENDSDLAMCDYDWFPAKSKMKEKWFRPYTGKKDTHFVERNSQPWNKIVRRELLESLHVGEHFESCFDEIYIRVLIEAKNPVCVPEKLYFYRIAENSMSSSYKNIEHYKRFVTASLALRRAMQDLTEKSDYWKQYFDYRISYYRLMTVIVASNAGDRECYNRTRHDLWKERPSFRKNMHFWPVLRENFGPLKAFVIGEVIPMNYQIARTVCLLAFH